MCENIYIYICVCVCVYMRPPKPTSGICKGSEVTCDRSYQKWAHGTMLAELCRWWFMKTLVGKTDSSSRPVSDFLQQMCEAWNCSRYLTFRRDGLGCESCCKDAWKMLGLKESNGEAQTTQHRQSCVGALLCLVCPYIIHPPVAVARPLPASTFLR